jgi:guanine deaminase
VIAIATLAQLLALGAGMKAYRGEILSVPDDPAVAGAARSAISRRPARGGGRPRPRLRPLCRARRTFAEAKPRTLDGLIVPGFVDAHVHYPQIERIASHGEQLMQWLERHIFPAEKAFADRGHADAIAAFFLDELLPPRHHQRFGLRHRPRRLGRRLVRGGAQRDMRIVSGKVLMDLGPEGLRDTVASGRADSEALIARWRGRGRLGYAVTPRFAPTSSREQLADAGAMIAAHPDVLMHTHLSENPGEIAFVAERFPRPGTISTSMTASAWSGRARSSPIAST